MHQFKQTTASIERVGCTPEQSSAKQYASPFSDTAADPADQASPSC